MVQGNLNFVVVGPKSKGFSGLTIRSSRARFAVSDATGPHRAGRLNSGVRFVMQRLPRLLLGLIALVASSCATTPPPSKFDGAQWWNGRGFDSEPRYVANGKFHHPPQNISETIPLTGLFAIPMSSTDCDQHPVAVTTPFPRERLLVPGSVADFYLSKVDPRLSTPVAVAILCGGRLVK